MGGEATTRRSVLRGARAGAFGLWVRPARAAPAPAPVPVVASFSILADLVRRVGGDRIAVTSLIGPEADAHGFEPAPADAARVAAARLLVTNGLGFEGWIDRLARAAGGRGPAAVVASRGVTPRRDDRHGSGEPATDPHAFQAVPNARLYVTNIRDGLITADPDGTAAYEANAAAYGAELAALDAEIRRDLSRIPPERRRVITSHDAFGYFAAAYGIRFIALRGLSSDSDVSARDVAAIVRRIRAEKIPAVFLETVSDPRLIERIADESGARIGGRLYSDALSRLDGPAATYVDLMRSNVRTLVEALAA